MQTNGGSGGVRSVQVKGPNSGWTGLKNIFGAAWEIPQQPQLPLDLHVTADSGQEVQSLSSDADKDTYQAIFKCVWFHSKLHVPLIVLARDLIVLKTDQPVVAYTVNSRTTTLEHLQGTDTYRGYFMTLQLQTSLHCLLICMLIAC